VPTSQSNSVSRIDSAHALSSFRFGCWSVLWEFGQEPINDLAACVPTVPMEKLADVEVNSYQLAIVLLGVIYRAAQGSLRITR